MNFGDYDLTEAVNIPFNTFSSNDPSESVTVTDFAIGDVEIHKDGSTTKRSSDSGVTISIDFDGVTGNHMVHIDLSDNTDVGYYSVGARYQVRLEGITVDAGTLNVFIGTFSVGCTLRPTTAGRTLDIQATGEVDANLTMMGGVAQSATDLKDFADAGYDPGTNKVTGVLLTDTCTTNTDMVGTDNAALASVLGAAVGASISADIAAQPTTTEFNARSLPSADYVVVGDTIAGVTLVTTCTTNTDMVGTAGANTTVPDAAGTAAGLHATTDALVNGVPTTAEFNARTIVSADYVVVGDTIAGVTLVTTCTTNTDLVSAADIIGTEVDNDGTAISLAGALKVLLSQAVAKTSGGGTTTLTFRDIADTKDRWVETVNATNNRTAITGLDAT